MTHVMITRTATGENGSSRVAHRTSSPTLSKALVGSDCSPDVVIIWGWSGLGIESIEAISQAKSNKIVGWVVRLQTGRPEWTLVDYLLGWKSSRKLGGSSMAG